MKRPQESSTAPIPMESRKSPDSELAQDVESFSPSYVDDIHEQLNPTSARPDSPQKLSDLIEDDEGLREKIIQEKQVAYEGLLRVSDALIQSVYAMLEPSALMALTQERLKLLNKQLGSNPSEEPVFERDWRAKVHVARREVIRDISSKFLGLYCEILPVLPFTVHYQEPPSAITQRIATSPDESMSFSIDALQNEVKDDQSGIEFEATSSTRRVENMYISHIDESVRPELVEQLRQQILSLNDESRYSTGIDPALIEEDQRQNQELDRYAYQTTQETLVKFESELRSRNEEAGRGYHTYRPQISSYVNYLKQIQKGAELFKIDHEPLTDPSNLQVRRIYQLPLDDAGNKLLDLVYQEHSLDQASVLSESQQIIIQKAPVAALMQPVPGYDTFLHFAISARNPDLGKLTMSRFAAQIEAIKADDLSEQDRKDLEEDIKLLKEGLQHLRDVKDHIKGYYDDRLDSRRRWGDFRKFLGRPYVKRIGERGEQCAQLMLALYKSTDRFDVSRFALEAEKLSESEHVTRGGLNKSELHDGIVAWRKKVVQVLDIARYNQAVVKYNERHGRTVSRADYEQDRATLKAELSSQKTELSSQKKKADQKIKRLEEAWARDKREAEQKIKSLEDARARDQKALDERFEEMEKLFRKQQQSEPSSSNKNASSNDAEPEDSSAKNTSSFFGKG